MTQDKLNFLRQRFLESAYVKDAIKGYIVVKDFNLSIDPDILYFASKLWAEHYQNLGQIDAIVGLPDAGSRLVSLLAEMLRINQILPSKRSSSVPGAWQDVVSYSNQSFTTGVEDVKSHIGFVRSGMKILIVDDVVARGETARAAIKALQDAGVEVMGLGVFFDKEWQGGVNKIFSETKIKTFSLISIKEITLKGEVKI